MDFSEKASYLAKIEELNAKVNHMQYESDKKSEELRLMNKKLELSTDKLKDLEQTSSELTKKLTRHQDDAKLFNALKDRNEAALYQLQDCNKDSSRRIASLETKIRSLNQELEISKSTFEDKRNFLSNVFNQLKVLICDESVNSPDRFDLLIEKISTKLGKNILLESEVNDLKASLEKSKLEILKIRSESGSIHSSFKTSIEEAEKLKRNSHVLVSEREELSAENELLRKRTKAQSDQISHWKTLCDQKDNERQGLEKRMRELDFELASLKTQANSFLNILATALSTVDDVCHANETSVRNAVVQRMDQLSSLKSYSSKSDKKLTELQTKLRKDFEYNEETIKNLTEKNSQMEIIKNDLNRLRDENETLKMLKSSDHDLLEKINILVEDLGTILNINFSTLVEEDPVESLTVIKDRLRDFMGSSEENICQMNSRHNSRSPTRCHRHQSICSRSRINSRSPGKNVSFLMENLPQKCVLCDVTGSDSLEFVESPFRMLIRSCADWSDNDWRVLRSLCENCLSKLHAEFKHQLLTAWEELNSFRHINEETSRHHTKDIKKFEDLKIQLYESQRECEKLTNQLKKSDVNLKQENENLLALIREMERSKEGYMKKIGHLEKTLEMQTNSSKNRTQQLKGAQQLLSSIRNKQVKLNEFRDYVASMMGMNPKCLPPNSETLILQRLYSILSGAVSIVAPTLTTCQTMAPISNIPVAAPQISFVEPQKPTKRLRSIERPRTRSKLNSSMDSEIVTGTRAGMICDRSQKY